jgi:hypothetical protein
MKQRGRALAKHNRLSEAPRVGRTVRNSMVVPRGAASSLAPDTQAARVSTGLYCPFPPEENPARAAAHLESVEWALEHGLVLEGPGVARLERARFAQLEAAAFPHAPLEMLTLATIWVTLFCALDDFVESSRLGVLGLSRYLSDALAALRGTNVKRADAIIVGFRDVGRRLKQTTDAGTAREFEREVEELFEAFVWEEINRSNAAHPDYSGYRIMRGTTVGLRPHFPLARAIGPSATSSSRDDGHLRELESKACLAVGWANDIFTYDKEIAAGEVHNIIAVLMRTDHLPLDLALERARALHDAEVCAFLQLQARIESSPDANDTTTYRVQHLRHWIGGHLLWAEQNGRYRPATAA